jgi:hypothetical protein
LSADKETTMSTYAIALFVHIVGALGFSVALGLEWVGLRQLRRAASAEAVRTWMGIFQYALRVGFVSMLGTVITGVYMMATVWRGVPWLGVTVASLILVIALSAALTRPRMKAIGQALATGYGPMSPTFQRRADHPLLWVSIQARAAITLGIILLKIAKPDLGGSLLAMAVAIVLGIASALPALRREPTPTVTAD